MQTCGHGTTGREERKPGERLDRAYRAGFLVGGGTGFPCGSGRSA